MTTLERFEPENVTTMTDCWAAESASMMRIPSPTERGFFDSEALEVISTIRTHGVATIAGARVEYTSEQPANEDEITDPVPLLITHGFGGIKGSYRNMRSAVAQSGKPAVTYRPARSQGMRGNLNPHNLLHPEELLSKAAWGVMRSIEQAQGYNIFDVSGHSMGGRTAADVAIHHPEHVRTAIFVAAVGLDEHSVPEMLKRGTRFLKADLAPALPQLIRDNDSRLAFEAVHYILRNFPRTVAEGLTAAGCDLHQRIARLGDYGIRTAAIQFQRDTFFPLEAVTAYSQHLFDKYFVYEDPLSNHITPQTDPKGVARVHTEILRELYAPKPPLHIVA